MSDPAPWQPAEPDPQGIRHQYPDPLAAMARAQMPAAVLRGAFAPQSCRALLERFAERGLMPPTPPAGRTRIDIGTSLGNKGSDKEDFLCHAAQTQSLFAELFSGLDDPVQTIYDNLAALAPDKRVQTAREPDGRQYGPAIFRIHYTQHAYRPHLDHVVLREKRFDYAVSRFRHQFAGILCLQNADDQGAAPQSLLHRRLWTPELDPYLEAGTFGDYAAQHGIARCQVDLEPGDLYFFNTRCLHEVPAVPGARARVVLAVFFGYSPADPEIYVWA
jgi:hypothetical protein